MTNRFPSFLAAAAPIALAAAAFAGGAPAYAQAEAAEQRHGFSVPAGRLAQSVLALSEQAGVQVVFDSEATGIVSGNAVSGSMALGEALDRLLSGTGLSWRWLRSGVVTIENASAAGGERVTGAVRVEGAQGSPYFGGAGVAAGVNGTNGSRDITATEGTGSFTSGALTIGSKVPQAMKDVPQSVSVLTHERLEQQNVTDFTTAMRQMPGVTAVQDGSNLGTLFYSRGFEIRSIQVDGGAPLNTGFDFQPLIDMAQYDHVELLRGAAGLFNGYGDPSGTVNLVRKKPLDHAQFVLEAQAGSWSRYRIVADATSPLALDGKLRGRLVMTWQDNHYFHDIAKDNKTLVYGIAELDATPTTLLTVGISHTRQDSVPWVNGLPRYQNGDDLTLPRSTALAFPWNRSNLTTTELFGGIEQMIGGEWTAKLNITHNRQSSTRKVGISSGAVNPLTGAGPMINGLYYAYDSEQISAEATMTGAFTVFGQRQEVTAGINHVNTDGGGRVIYHNLMPGTAAAPYVPYPGGPQYCSSVTVCPAGARPPIDVFNFDPYDLRYIEPRNSLPSSRNPLNGQIVTTAYVNLRLTAFDRLHLVTGLRWSRYEYRYLLENLCSSIPATGTPAPNNCVGRQIGDAYLPTRSVYNGSDISWPPSVNLSYDVTDRLTAYVGYTDIYLSNASSLDADLQPIDPITGGNIEVGLKWQTRDGRLNVSLAAYRIRQKGYAAQDGEYDYNVTPEDIANGITYYFVATNGRRVPLGVVTPSVYCCFRSDPDAMRKSDGFDIDVTGTLLSGWQIAASYTYNRNRMEGAWFGPGNDGLPNVSIQPEHLYKLWTSFDFGGAGKSGFLSGLTLSGGVNGQSSAYRAGTACTELNPPNALGISTCRPGATVPFEFTVPAYAVLSGRIDYRVSRRWSLAVNLENILDKTYYQSVGSVTQGNWYGVPRSFTASLRAKW